MLANKFNSTLSQKSLERLNTCHPHLIECILALADEIDITVIEGYRSDEKQLELFLAGKSKIRSGGKHCQKPSLAVDIAPLPLDWNDSESFYNMASRLLAIAKSKNINLRWGGDWDGDGDFKDQSFNDLVHFELSDGV